jgi:integrase
VSYIDATLKGFAVRVSPSGVKAFTLVHGKERRRENLGRWPQTSLASARKRAVEILAEKTLGGRSLPRMTFEEAYKLFKSLYEAKNRPKTVYETDRLITKHLMPKLRRKDLSDITTQDVAPIIEKLIGKPGECKSLFTAARTLFRWMEKRRLIERSPIAGLDVPVRSESRSHLLTDAELAAVLRLAIAEQTTYGRIVELLIRTGQRVKQITHLRGEWIDCDAQTITWPKEVMKSKREHTIPYPDAVAAIFDTLPKDGLLFPARGREKPFNGFSKSKELFDAKLSDVRPYTQHDFRRNLSSGCAALQVDPMTVERVLAHAIPGVMGIYNRYSFLEPMRRALQLWETHLHTLLSKLESVNGNGLQGLYQDPAVAVRKRAPRARRAAA